MGHHARGIRNRNGHALANFCLTYHLFATNTGFRKRATHKTTWCQRRTDYHVFNQIDYILCQQNCRRFCMDAQSWGGTTTASDHKLVTADFVLTQARRLRFPRRPEAAQSLHIARDRLTYDDAIQDKYTTALKAAIRPTNETPVAQQWNSLMDLIHDTAEATIGVNTAPTRSKRYDDPVLAALSERQRALQICIYHDRQASTWTLRQERNAIMHQIQLRCRDLANRALDEQIKFIESLSPTALMFEAVRAINRTRVQPLLLHDATGKYILHELTANNLVRSHFQEQLSTPTRLPIHPDLEARGLDSPITATEFTTALRRLNNRRASGPDGIPGELLKYGAEALAPHLADLVNKSFERGQPLNLREGTLLGLPKPNKPRGECSSLRPIVLLNSIRKAVSILVLNRISPAVERFLSPHQCGFRMYRSTADAVWMHRWLCARVQRYQERIHVLGIDLSRAFDTIDRHKLLDVLRTFLSDDDIRLVRLLLANTTLALRSGRRTLDPFVSNTGTPQGDSLSPVLFVVYLEAALRDLARELDVPHALLEQMVVYADDADFICRDQTAIQVILSKAPNILAHWSLTMNIFKTEITELCRHVNPGGHNRLTRAAEEQWRSTRKLGSLLGDSEDLTRRKALAAAALRRLWTIWLRTHYTTDTTRIRLYNCYVLPVLLYNCGTWALTTSELRGLESFHRRQLRNVLSIRYPRHVSNATLYELCGERPLRHRITTARWGLFGHILRRPDIPAYTQMAAYYAPSDAGKWRGRPRTTLPVILDADLVTSGQGYRLRDAQDLEELRNLAGDRGKWRILLAAIADSLPADGDSTYADTTLCRRLAKLSLAQV
ncbi:hypothetical protein PF003_g3837 [Phytophthora fragariae]|nr:hypothetical protein PF003_g3837 [Phytophthora fragariae]